ncbi:hypothetical protein [Candidatus Xianfuyuplasma coldseepsis]|uniref:Uncharacterized protein n=1 Tax=Candidatus Xianfuyuplasma coldseepsis TaxID=2782163 RepID=A0A7L7KRE1_9MOLU|nr:hypothetical protein [Xianfuyuplasma coldseepsis]QMS84842.1 hypothetical protein G4Z02_03425 [Xianfuyuplasma coldseepsis]
MDEDKRAFQASENQLLYKKTLSSDNFIIDQIKQAYLLSLPYLPMDSLEESEKIASLFDLLKRNMAYKKGLMDQTVSLITEDAFNEWFKT